MLAIDEASYREFVTVRRRALLRTAYLLTGDWHAAEDVVQETLAKLYVSWRRVRRREEAIGYARRTLLTTYIDSTRRPWRREHTVDALPDLVGAGDPADLGAPDTRHRLMAALARVPARQRAVVVLRFWEDLSVEQVAELLSCSSGNVKSQTARGLERLRELLGADDLMALRDAV
ncbi:SigE family RNA polymerase sigma factor [Jiangella asiatica]|uniref:SigE family RNA polymerase sigma factor n=1 Tax=Jiangella asiatica TaxID=2530372 RepID=A0A4V2Z004_9ACTN|nr:SigE family RNA polymerase sigma factor [Jiangella asiatica]TDD99137.1 SigE family RNA polymerase sigma factor [Jiangella asiatica]